MNVAAACANGVQTVTVNGYVLKLTDRGARLAVGDRMLDLAGAPRTIRVPKSPKPAVATPSGRST